MNNIKNTVKKSISNSLQTIINKSGVEYLENNNTMQDEILKGISSSIDDQRVGLTCQDSIVKLDNSGNGSIIVDSIEGNTLFNACYDGSISQPLNNEIELQGNNLEILDTATGGKLDVACNGVTLVNIACPHNIEGTWVDNEYLRINVKNLYSQFSIRHRGCPEESSVLTVRMEIVKNTSTVPIVARRYNGQYVGWTDIDPGFVGTKIFKFITPAQREYARWMWFENTTVGEGEVLIRLTVLKGDYTDKFIPPYFKGSISLGQLEGNSLPLVTRGYTTTERDSTETNNIVYSDTNSNDLVLVSEIWGNTIQDQDSVNLLDESLLVSNTYSERRTMEFTNGKVVVTNVTEYSFATEEHHTIYLQSGWYTWSVANYQNPDNMYVSYMLRDSDGNDIHLFNIKNNVLTFRLESNGFYIIKSNVLGEAITQCSFNIQLEKSQASTKYVPYYKSDMTQIDSLGELYVDSQGEPILDSKGNKQYAINITSTGKNVFNINEYSTYDDTWTKDAYSTKQIKLKPNTTYTSSAKRLKDVPDSYTIFTLSGQASGQALYVQVNTDLSLNYFFDNRTFTTDETGIMTFNYYCDSKDTTWFTDFVGDIQIEESPVATEYEEYTESNKTILLPQQLHRIGNTYDRLYWDDFSNRYIIEKNILRYDLDQLNLNTTPTVGDFTARMDLMLANNIGLYNSKGGPGNVIAKGLREVSYYTGHGRDHELATYSFNYDAGGAWFGICLPRGFSTKDSFLEELNSIGTYFLCKAIHPEYVYTDIKEKIYVDAFSGITHVGSLKSNIDCYGLVTSYQTVTGNKTKVSVVNVPLNEPLRRINDNIYDKLVKVENTWYVYRYCHEIIIDGSEENIRLYKHDEVNNIVYYDIKVPDLAYLPSEAWDNNISVSDSMHTVPFRNIYVGDSPYECLGLFNNNNRGVVVGIKYSRYSNTEISSIRKFLNSTPIKLIYKREYPLREKINIPSVVTTYDEVTLVNSPAELSCELNITNNSYQSRLLPNTKYTIIFNREGAGELKCILSGVESDVISKDIVKLTTPQVVSQDLRFVGKGNTISNVRVIPGDLDYHAPMFNNLKSSYEGDNEVVIKSTGTNLFDDEEFYNDWKSKQPSYIYKEYIDGELVYKIMDGSHLWDESQGYRIKVKKGRKYSLSFYGKYITQSTNNPILVRNGNKTVGGLYLWDNTFTYREGTFVAENDYITICSGYNGHVYHHIKNIVLVELETDSLKEPHKSSSVKLSLQEPLRGFGAYRDKLYKRDNKLIVERYIKEFDFTKHLDRLITAFHHNNEDTMCYEIQTNFYNQISDDEFYCTSLAAQYVGIPTKPFSTWIWNRTHILIVLDKSISTVEQARQWLLDNPTKMYYQSTQPTYEVIDYEYGNTLLLDSYDKGNLVVPTDIYPRLNVRYPMKFESIRTLKDISEGNQSLSQDIQDNVLPYIMEVDLALLTIEMSSLSRSKSLLIMEDDDMTSMQKRTYDMLERLIRSKTLTNQEAKDRVLLYESAGKITSEQALELMIVISETYTR